MTQVESTVAWKRSQRPLLFAAVIAAMSLYSFVRNIGSAKSESKLTASPAKARAIAEGKASPERLREHVRALTSTQAPRTYSNMDGLREAARYIREAFEREGHEVKRQTFSVDGNTYENLIVSLGPENAPRIVIGAHYDVAGDQPGADDNASGIAGLIELSRMLKDRAPSLNHRIDLVAFSLEEPPFFASSAMGSAVHASSLKKEGARVDLMLSLEMIGYFSDEPGSQDFPVPSLNRLYPDKGNFIAIAGDMNSIDLAKKVKKLMKSGSRIDVQSINAPRSLPGIDLSDHRSYWEEGFPALMLTDTAFYRNPNYHSVSDRIGTLDFGKMAEVVNGVYAVATRF